MSVYINTIEKHLFFKTGKRACELDYMELPNDDLKYNAKLSIGNIHLLAGRIKTKKRAEKSVEKFLGIKIP